MSIAMRMKRNRDALLNKNENFNATTQISHNPFNGNGGGVK